MARSLIAAAGLFAALAGSTGFAQRAQTAPEADTYSRLEGGGTVNEDKVRTARETAGHSVDLPQWSNPRGFEKDVFTFARIIFKSGPVSDGGFGGGFGSGFGGRGGGFGGGRLGWWVDYPDADINFSYRLQQLTSLKVDPDARVFKLTNPDLVKFPFVFMEHVEGMVLSDKEQEILRKYLLNGGALLVEDFWGRAAWEHFVAQMAQVLPGRSWVELTMDHPIFHGIFDLRGPMSELRVPTIQFWNWNYEPGNPYSNPTRVNRGEGYETMHVRALMDDKQRIMAIAIHNSDISDGWEREGENSDYFKTFAETRAYPLGINIIYYLMTH